jgi:hypothetical protein
MLGLSGQTRAAPRPGQPAPTQAFGAARFLLPVQQVEFQLTGILESLSRDPWPVANDKRPLRCTGNAISVAVGLLEVGYDNWHSSVANIWVIRLLTLIPVRESWFSPAVLAQRAPVWLSAMNSRNPFDPITILTVIVRNTLNVPQR